MEIFEFLKSNIRDGMSLFEMIDTFEKMCAIPLDTDITDEEDDIVLFETGVFDFTGKPQFIFSLVRQYPDGDGEYFQLHMDVFFTPDEKNSHISCTEWSDCIDGDFFEFVKNSEAYIAVKDAKPADVGIRLDQT